jgi:hypothetical protein
MATLIPNAAAILIDLVAITSHSNRSSLPLT